MIHTVTLLAFGLDIPGLSPLCAHLAVAASQESHYIVAHLAEAVSTPQPRCCMCQRGACRADVHRAAWLSVVSDRWLSRSHELAHPQSTAALWPATGPLRCSPSRGQSAVMAVQGLLLLLPSVMKSCICWSWRLPACSCRGGHPSPDTHAGPSPCPLKAQVGLGRC